VTARLLLDTNALLWWLADDGERLGAVARDRIADPDAAVYVSAISSTEIAIKQSIGKLRAPDDLADQVEANGFIELPLLIRHGSTLATLPCHHRDPFDRMLLAQASSEGLTLITGDRALAAYDVPLIPTWQ
jgi:PIN domain nuclease of toxin-antitoxin system